MRIENWGLGVRIGTYDSNTLKWSSVVDYVNIVWTLERSERSLRLVVGS